MRPPNIVLPPAGKADRMGQTDALEMRSINSILLVPPFPGIDPRATRTLPEAEEKFFIL
jgi:hypothetical protein